MSQRMHLASEPFHILATRYVPENRHPAATLTLVLLHGLGQHKETWEPLLSYLLSGPAARNIYEVYSIENPNHGESAVLNDDVLDTDSYRNNWKASAYSNAAYAFLTAGANQGAKVDFMSRTIIGIGHSLGGVALTLLAEKEPRLPFRALILIEAPMASLDHPHRFVMLRTSFNFIWPRKDVWHSLKQAERDLRAHPLYSTWHPTAFDLYLKFGLRPHKASKYPEPYNFKGVSTALTKDHEAATFRDEEPSSTGMAALTKLSADATMDIHLVFGSVEDFASQELKEYQIKHSTPRSVTWVDDYGHFCVQQAPEKLASIISQLLPTEDRALVAKL